MRVERQYRTMAAIILSTCASCGVATSPSGAGENELPEFSAVVVFGDSGNDNGNLFALNGGISPPSPPYYMGRFSNGPIWAELLPPMLGVDDEDVTNLALGGASTPAMLDFQIAPFVASGAVDPEALFVLSAGSPNDVIRVILQGVPPEVAIREAIANVRASIELLAGAGATRFAALDVLPFASAPFFVKGFPELVEFLNGGAATLNDAMRAALDDLEMQLDVEITRISRFDLTVAIMADPAAYGFTNVTDGAIQPDTILWFEPDLPPEVLALREIAPNPDEYLWWDIHQTARANDLLAESAFSEITCPWDLDDDGRVGVADIIKLLANFGDPHTTADLLDLLESHGACPEPAEAE